MMGSITVLCPNGHRVTVKTTPTTSLLKVLEEACHKKGYNADLYDLKTESGKSSLDLSLQYRYANLPNNARLELITAAQPRSSAEAKVTLTLQMPDGKRLDPLEFAPNDSLYHVLGSFEKATNTSLEGDSDSDPVLVHLRDETVGVATMQRTTLKAIGLISGRGLLRLSHRPKTLSAGASDGVDVDPLAGMTLKKEHLEMIESIDKGFKEYQKGIQNQDSSKAAPVKPSNGPSTSSPAPYVFPGPSRDFLPSQPPPNRRPPSPPPQVPLDLPQQMDFSNFKFPEPSSSTPGLGVATTSTTMLSDPSSEPCDREWKVFSLDSKQVKTSDSSSSMEIDDSFFEVTIDDLRSRMSALKKDIEDDAPLMTKAMVERKEEARFAAYHRTMIRIYFPDRLVLQGMFRLKEPTSALYYFVASHLASPDEPFTLYTTPPRQDLKDREANLIKAKLVPAANVYFSAKTGSNTLSAKCLEQLTSADAVVKSVDCDGTQNAESLTQGSSSSTDEDQPPAKRPSTDVKGKGAPGQNPKVPKWFNAGKKK